MQAEDNISKLPDMTIRGFCSAILNTIDIVFNDKYSITIQLDLRPLHHILDSFFVKFRAGSSVARIHRNCNITVRKS